MNSSKKSIRIGAGAGYSGDRIEPAVDLARHGHLRYLVFECLAERTIALAQQARARDPNAGFDPFLEERMMACLPICQANKVRIITNMGAANPLAAMHKTAEIAQKNGIRNLRIAAVTGDDVLSEVQSGDYILMETGQPLKSLSGRLLSANAYLGVSPITEALAQGADVIITGRVADPALFLAPLLHEFGWSLRDYDLLGQGTLLGHLMECAGQITGGYFADPGFKDVPGIERLGFPVAEVTRDGQFFITKLSESGGMVTESTCKEQLLYEIHDPASYHTPDVVADFSQVMVSEIGKDQVRVTGATGRPPTGLLKVSVGYYDSFIGEGQISYGGPGAVDRASLALAIIRKRLEMRGLTNDENRFELIGINSLRNSAEQVGDLDEVRVRVAVRTDNIGDAIQIGNEVESLYTNGPAGGGGVSKTSREIIAVQSILIESGLVQTRNYYLDT